MSTLSEESRKRLRKDLELDKKGDKPITVSYLETEDWIAEEVLGTKSGQAGLSGLVQQEDGVFLRYYKNNPENLEYISEINLEGIVYEPINNKVVKEGGILLPTGVEEYEDDDKLVEDIKEFLFEYIEVPSFYKAILPYIVLFYWVADRFPFIPYLHFLGLPGTGKSTALEVMGHICYKPIFASGAITMASIFRLANTFRGTLLLDEFELGDKGSENYNQIVQLLKSGVEDRPIFRTEGEGKKEVEMYRIKSPRIFSSQSPINNAALQSRTIQIHMVKTQKRLPLYRLKKFQDKAQLLRNKLLFWRLRHLDKIKLEDIERGFDELQSFDKRVQQVLTPIYYLANEEVKNTILSLIKDQEVETKRERLEEIDGQITIYLLNQEGIDTTISDVVKFLNDSREAQGYRKRLTGRFIGGIIRKQMGFMAERRGGEFHLIVTPSKIKELKDYYGIDDELVEASTPSSVIRTSPGSPGSPDNDNNNNNYKIDIDEGKKEDTWTEPDPRW